jgi:hypothetical protein
MYRGLLAFFVLEGLVAAQIWLAHNDRFLTVSEMQKKGVDEGLPLVWHFGIWGDVFVIGPLTAITIATYSDRWTWGQTLAALAIGVLVTIVMGWIYTWWGTPTVHVQEHRTTTAGFVHLVYMAIAVTIFILLYFCTAQPGRAFLVGTSVLLFIHLFFGTHMVLGLASHFGHFDWYPDRPLASLVGWMTIVVLGAGLCWRTYASGWSNM